ncbi:tripartite tricarboxylate transporter substrate binding protein [Salibacterium aidingense]|uniref:tripartite tricarboxylate transporter substrate binding protein n=1 Tax=Salibacterium aidingense TaxID=384933 RepID=UPI003BC8396F
MKKRVTSFGLIGLMFFSLVGCGSSQSGAETNFPDGTIEMVVPYDAGGGTDNAARIVSDALSEELGVKVAIVNKPGAGGEIGFTEIANAKPDGYTIGVLGSPDYQYLTATKETDYSLDDFDYLAAYNRSLPMIIAREGSFKSLEEMFEYGKENPGEVTLGASGGGPKTEAAMTMHYGEFEGTIVDFTGSAETVKALLAGDIDAGMLTPSYLPTLSPEGAEPLAYFTEEKVEDYEEVPSFQELGFEVDIAHNPVFVLPTGVPEEVREVIMEAMNKVGEKSEVKEQFEEINTVYKYMEGEELEEYSDSLLEIIETMADEYEEAFKN